MPLWNKNSKGFDMEITKNGVTVNYMVAVKYYVCACVIAKRKLKESCYIIQVTIKSGENIITLHTCYYYEIIIMNGRENQ